MQLGPADREGRPNKNGKMIVNAVNDQQCTALLSAVMGGSTLTAGQLGEVTRALLAGGCDVNLQGGYGVSALQVAAASGCVYTVQLLLAAGEWSAHAIHTAT